MKKLWLTVAISFLLGTSASATLPPEGYYLGKDGAPLTEDAQTPPAVKSAKMAPQTKAVQESMAILPHSATTLIRLTITEDGTVLNPEVIQSSGSIILDQYAMESVNSWSFRPAKRGEKAIPMMVSVPIRFISTMITTPAMATVKILKDMPSEVKDAAERNHHPSLSIKLYINSTGKPEGKPEVERSDILTPADYKILSKYVENCIKNWTFTAAKNPDGESIGSLATISVQL